MRFKIYFLGMLLSLISFLFPSQVKASHIMGGEITWECTADGRYIFNFKVYRDCSGAVLQPTGTLRIHNYPNAGNVTTLNFNFVSDSDISPNCKGGAVYSCSNRDAEAVEEFIRVTNPIRLIGRPPAAGWIITYNDNARNPTTNLSPVGITLRAKMFPHSGTVNDTCVDNSPVFRERATSLLCLGTSFTYNHNATDDELDVLQYEWAKPLNNLSGLFVTGSNPTEIAFQSGYSYLSPFPSNIQDARNQAAVLDPNTGEISMTSFTSGKFVSVVKVSAFKCGEKVAEIYRELQSNISANCPVNNQPTIRAPFQNSNGQFTLFKDTVRAGDLVNFNIQVTDFDLHPDFSLQTVTLQGTGLQFGTNYTSTTSGCPNPPCAILTNQLPMSGLAGVNTSFSWQTDCNHIAYNDGCVSLENTYTFVIRAVDDACPIPAQNIATISITVLADSVLDSPNINCLDVASNGDVTVDWNTTPDPNNSFTAWMLYSGTNANGPFTLVDSIKTYNQTSYTHVGAGANTQRRWYYLRSRSGCKGLVQNIARDTLSTIFVDPNVVGDKVVVDWNSLSNPNPTGSANQYRLFRQYPVTSSLNFFQNKSGLSHTENFNLCTDTATYRVDLVNTIEGCTSKSNVAGIRFRFPEPQVNFSFPANPCPNTSINFNNTTTISAGTVSYTWDFGDGTPTSNIKSPNHTYALAGTYNVTLTALSNVGCDSVLIQQITVTFPDADAGVDKSICPGGTVQIGGSPTSTTAGATFSWSPAASLNNPTSANPMASPAVTTTYTVTVTDPQGCTNTDAVIVNVNSVPTADAGGPFTLCNGSTVVIGGSPTGPAGATYLWNNAGTLSSATVANPIASPTVTTTYTVTVTSGVNCSAVDQVTVTVVNGPNVDAGTNKLICPGTSVLIGGSPTSSTAGVTFLWDNAGTLNNATSANPLATPLATTMYHVTVTGPNSCTSVDSVEVRHRVAFADAGSDLTICEGGVAQIGGSPTGPPGSSFLWDNAGSLSNASDQNPLATPTVTTTYTVTVTATNGCVVTDQVTITVIPAPTADAGADKNLCNGASVTIGGSPTSPGGTSVLWNNAATLSSATAKNPIATPTVTTTYTVTVTDLLTSCTATDAVTVTVNPNPVADAGPNVIICNGGSTPIGGSPTSSIPGVSYAWSNAGTLNNATIANPIATPLTTTNYRVTITTAAGCTDTDQMQVRVNANPTADAGPDQTICSGLNVSLGGAPTGPVGSTFLWDNAGTLSSAIVANPTATPLVTTTYSVTVTNGSNCSSVDQVTITVNPNPDADAGLNKSICPGASVQIGGSPTSTVAGATYRWNQPGTLSNRVLANPIASPSITTTYTVTVTHPNGCTNTDQMTVTVLPNAAVDAGPNLSICNGGSIQIGGSPTGAAGSTYLWDNATSLSSASIANPIASPSITTTYSVTVTDASGCTGVDQMILTVGALPTVNAGADQTICLGSTATLGGSPTGPVTATFLWDNATSLNNPNIANPIASPTVTTTYSVTVTDGVGCSDVDQITITVIPVPTADAGPDKSICNGGAVQIGGSPTGLAGATFAWNNAGSLNDASLANPTASPSATTTYTVTVTHPNGCTATDQVTVSLFPLTLADAGPNQNLCFGGSIQIGGSPTGAVGSTYLWDNAGSLSGNTLANPIASPTVTTTYSVTVTDINTCTSTDQMIVTVGSLPPVDAGLDQTICSGQTVQIGGSPTGPAGSTYNWDNATSLSNATIANPNASPTVTTNYSVTVTDASGCTDVDQVLITVNPLPVVDAGPNQSICVNGSVQIGGSPTGPVGSTFAWDNATSLNNASLANPTASPSVTTTYTVTVTQANGCSATDQVTVSLFPVPLADAGPDLSLCFGGSVQIGGSPTGAAGSTYLWDNAASLSSNVVPNPTANPTVTTTYTVTVTDINACTSTDQMTITIGSLPAVDAGLDQTICVGASVQIGGSPTGPAGASYVWDNAASLSNATIANPIASPAVTTNYTVTVTDASGCSDVDQVLVTVNSLPGADAGVDQTICDGFSVQIGGSPTGPVGATFLWDNAATLNNITLANPTANPTVTTTYTVTVTLANGCSNTDQMIVNVNSNPTADAGADQSICTGTSTNIGGSPTGPAGSSYVWDNAASLNNANVANPIATPVANTAYSVTITDANGCTDVDQVNITLIPNPDVDAGPDQTICEGSSIGIGGSPTSSIVGATFAWDNSSSLSNASIANPIANPIVTTTYTVTVTHTNGCTASDQVIVNVNPSPLVDAGVNQTICNGGSIQIGGSPTGPAGSSYVWDNVGSLSNATIANPLASPVVTTLYTVTVTDISGCTNTDQVTVTVNGLPVVDAGVDQTICNGGSASIGGSPTGPAGSSFTWDNAATLNNANIANPSASPTATTVYSVTVSDVNGCTGVDQVTVIVNPVPSVDAGPDVTICDLQSTVIGGSPTSTVVGATFLWNNAASLNNATDPNPIATPSVTTTYTVTVTHTNSCTSTDQMTVTVNPIPTADAGADQTICIGSSANIGGSPTGPAGSTFAWDNAASLNSATAANPIATPTFTTTYTVTVTDGVGCTNTDQVTITVNPIPDADAGPDQTICRLQSVSIGGAPTSSVVGATYAWDNGASLSSASIANPIANPSLSTTYTVTVTHPNGCTNTDQVIVFVNQLPVTDAGVDKTICFGGSVIIGGAPTAPVGSTILWDNASSLSNNTLANPVANPTVTTVYTVTVTDGNGCTNTDQMTVNVNPLPVADAGPDVSICFGSSTGIGGSPTGPAGSTFNWDNATSLNNASLSNPTANPTVTTTYTVTITDVNGCTDIDQVLVTVLPIPDANAGADQTICNLQSVTIGGTPTSTVVGATFAWDNATSLNNASLANPVASPTSTTTYTVTVTHPNGCTNTDQVTVNVNALPVVDAGPDRNLCIGLSTVIGGAPTGPAGSTYNWDNGTSLSNATLANPTATPSVTTTYTVTVTDGNGCTNTDQVTITVNPLPDVDAGPDLTICNLQSTRIGGSPTSTVVGATFSWDNIASLNASNVANPTASPNVTTTYSVTVTHPNGCTDVDQMTLTVNPLPVVDAGSDQTICFGGSIAIGGSPTGPTGASYNWDNATTLNNANVANPIANPIVTTTYTVTVTDGTTGCTNTDNVTVIVNPLPIVDAGVDRIICEGQSTNLGGSPTGPAGSTFLWDNVASLNNFNIANPIASPIITTTYSVTVTDVNGCVNTDQVLITVNPAPDVDAGPDFTICDTDSIQIGGSPTSTVVGATFNWAPAASLNDATASNPFARPSATTKYYVTVSDVAGCTSVDSVVINVNPIPVVDFRVDETCISDLAAFTDVSTIPSGNLFSWTWDFGDGVGASILQNPGYQYSNPGTYQVKLIVTSTLGCSDSIVKSVTINALPIVDAGPDAAICFGDTIVLGGNPTGPLGAVFSWNPGFDLSDVTAANPKSYPLSNTSYYLSVTDVNGCINYDTVNLIVNPLPNVTASPDTSLCVNQPVQLLAVGANAYVWSPSKWLDNALIPNPIARALENVDYIVYGSDLNGCVNTDTVSIEVFNLNFISFDTSVCYGDSITLVPIIQGDETGITYSWTPSIGLSASNIRQPKSSPLVDQKYELSIANEFGCEDRDSVYVDVLETANVNFEYENSPRCSGTALIIQNTSTYTQTYQWFLNGKYVGNEFQPNFRVDNTVDNKLTLVGSNSNCTDSISKIIPAATFKDLLELKYANIFTPNGDGQNDIFDLGFTGEFIGCASFTVYDRWGTKVFDTNIGKYGWDGRTLRGELSPMGIYYYIIKIGNEEIKGSVFLSR